MKINNTYTENMEELFNTMKTSSLQIVVPVKGEEFQLNGIDHIFNKYDR